MEASQGETEFRCDLGGGRESIWLVKAGRTYFPRKIRFARPLRHHVANLLTDICRDWVGIRTWQLKHSRIKVPFHAISIEVDRTVEHALIVAPMYRRGEGKYHPLAWKGQLE